MQLTAPLFLFLFLPASLALFFLTPRRWRTVTLTVISLAWLTLVNLNSPWGLLHIALTVLFALTLSRFVPKKPRLAAVGALPLFLSLLASRLLAALCSSYSYPTGLLFITLSAISLLFDRARGDVKQNDSTLRALCYLLFFPTATLGPAVRYKHFLVLLRKSAPSTTRFCEGIRLFMLGFIKRIAVAAVFHRALGTILDKAEGMPLVALPAALLLAFLWLYFFVSGCADMARGISAMYGLRLPRDRANLLRATTPHGMLYALFFSLHRHLEDYLLTPLSRRVDGKRGRVLTALLTPTLLLLLLAPSPTSWIVALPIFATAAFSALKGEPRGKQHPLLSILFFLASAFFCSLLSLAAMGDPRRLLALLRAMLGGEAARFYSFYFILPDLQYILLVAVLFLLITLLLQLYRRYANRLGANTCFYISLFVTALLLAAFLLALLYFMPQFPQYALSPFGL